MAKNKTAEAMTEATAAVPAEPKGPRVSKHAEIAPAVRAFRATPRDDDPTKPMYTHDQVGEKFGLKGSLVSMIVRNKVAHDPNYTPVFDGQRDLGPRKPKIEAGDAPAAATQEQAEADAAGEGDESNEATDTSDESQDENA